MVGQLLDKIAKTNAPICVGLDPMLSYIPSHVVKKSFDEWGETLEGATDAVWQFNKEIIDCIYDLVPSVKPQIAMYEQFGIEGLKVYQKTIDYCREKGLVVIGDAKRGDIGSTRHNWQGSFPNAHKKIEKNRQPFLIFPHYIIVQRWYKVVTNSRSPGLGRAFAELTIRK